MNVKAESLVRGTLLVSVGFNLFAAWLFAVPSSGPAQLLGFPEYVPPLYTVLTAYLVAVFAAMYAWMGVQPHPDRELLAVGALGKIGVFVSAFGLWLAGELGAGLVFLALGDLGLGSFWLAWLVFGESEG